MSGRKAQKRRKKTASDRWLPRRIKTTREGKFLIFFTIGLGFAAINTGNNLLYLILGMLLSLIIVSGILSELTLRDVTVERVFHTAIHAKRATFLEYRVRNAKKRFASFSIEVEEAFENPSIGQWRPAYALIIRPGETRTVSMRITFGKRGVYQSHGMRLATRYPFGFFRKWRFLRAPLELVAFPALHRVEPPTVASRADGFMDHRHRLGRGDEFHALHDYLPGDDPRAIHWKTSARFNRLMTREYEAAAEYRVTVMVPSTIPVDGDEEIAEQAISEAASMVAGYSRAGWAVGIQTTAGTMRPDRGPGHLRALFGHLARIEVVADDSEVVAASVPMGRRRKGEGAVLVCHPEQRIPSDWFGWQHRHLCGQSSEVQEGGHAV